MSDTMNTPWNSFLTEITVKSCKQSLSIHVINNFRKKIKTANYDVWENDRGVWGCGASISTN